MEAASACNDLERAMKSYAHAVQRLALVYLKNIDDAQDAAQDVFLTYYRKAPIFTSAQKERSWLLTVTANRCKSMLRRKCWMEQPVLEDLQYLPKEENEVLQAVMSLEEKYRLAIHLHYYEGYCLEEIGKLMGARPGTVGCWLSRGREKLKKILEEDYNGE